jgi:hypothetical protein
VGAKSPLAKSVEALEATPDSKRQVTVLAENVAAAKATSDPEVLQALAKLIDELKKEGIGGKAIAAITIKITGGTVQGVVGAKNVSIDSMSFDAASGRRKG